MCGITFAHAREQLSWGLYHEAGSTNSRFQNWFRIDKTKPKQSGFIGTMTPLINGLCQPRL